MRYLSLAGLVPLACACSGTGGSAAEDAWRIDPRPLATTLVYECSGYRFTARLGPGEMAMWLPDRYTVLAQVHTASGVRYEEGDTSVQLDNGQLTLNVNGQAFRDCRLLPEESPWEDARRRMMDFRAVGVTPDWQLELRLGRHALFTAEGVMQRLLFEDVVSSDAEDATRYHAQSPTATLVVESEPTPCRLPGSSRDLPARVRVTLGPLLFEGCGQALDHPWVDDP
ncbi:MAG: hypothetical protein KDI09_15660 [Halioglobus sp.]|nr:hypothetical protein [Halioglobus sp.]